MTVTITWNEAAKIAKKLQKKYQLPIFAMTYQGSCSCCAAPCDLNKQAYLTPEVKEQPWSERTRHHCLIQDDSVSPQSAVFTNLNR